jgi:hypothetical protein
VFHSTTLGCSTCGSGIVAFVVAAESRHLVLFCIQCGAWYATAEHHNHQLTDLTSAEGPDLRLAGCDCSVKFPPARWATAEEVRDFGWGDYLAPEPNPWSPDKAWPEAEREARLRGVDVWAWHAARMEPPPTAEPSKARLLDPYGRPFEETDVGADRPGD